MKSSRHNLVPIRLGIALLVGVATLATATSINMRMGTLWDVYDDNGNEGWGGSALVWPGAIHVPYEATAGGTINEGQASVSYKGFLYGATNFVVPDTGAAIGGFWIEDKDVPNGAGPPAPGDVLPYYVVVRDIPNHQGGDWNGVQLLRSGLQGDADEVRGTEVMLRHPLTEVRVDGVLQSKLQDGSEEAIINPNLGADIVVHQWWRINMGITTHRYLAQNLHEDHDDYIVWHYRFENDGRYNQSNASISHGNQINGFYYSWSTWFMDRAEGGRLHGTTGENRGDNATEYDPGTRMMFGFDRDAIDTPGDDTGDPHPATGEMISARFAGIAVVHADVSTTDRSDDPEQPKRFDYDNHRACIGLKTHGSQRLGVTGQEGPFGFEPLYKSMMWPGGEMRPWTPSDGSNFYKGEGADAGGRWAKSSRELGWPVGDIAYTGGFFTDASEEITAEEVERVNAANTWFSVGGWDIPSGEHINVTWVAAVGGMPRKRAREIAAGQ
ncbi:MAG: hypothetical protein QGH20_07510, partial [Candidatus Latescibacteria bacterium]|nr:hypothetical protein [Candidatus Latescibacterota bacterium]